MLHDFFNEDRKSIDLTAWDVSNVTNMDYFINSQDIKITGWDTSKVTSMKYSFCNCGFIDGDNLILDTSNLECMEGTFYSANIFSNVRNLNTSKVTNMKSTFRVVNFPVGYNLNNWDTSKVTTMEGMFAYSNFPLVQINFWDTRNVTTMREMFYEATLRELPNIFTWDLSNLKDSSYMFGLCEGIDEIDLHNLDTSNIENMEGMFYVCQQRTVNLSNWRLDNCKNLHALFWYAETVYLDISNWNLPDPDSVDTSSMFGNSKLYEIRMDNCNANTLRKLINQIISDFGYRMLHESKKLKIHCKESELLQAIDLINDPYYSLFASGLQFVYV